MTRTWQKESEYFSGQGVVLVGFRDANGKPRGLRPVGNVSALSIATAIQYTEHRESQSGDRAVDRRKPSQTDVTYSATWEDFSAENLALLLRSTVETVAEGTVADVPYTGYAGLVTAFDHIAITGLVLKAGSTTLNAYVDENTAYDYEFNLDAGSVSFNPASPNLGITITDITVGATTTVTVADTSDIVVGSTLKVAGATGTDAGDLNGVDAEVTAKTATTVTLAVVTTGKTITPAAGTKLLTGTIKFTASYSYDTQVELNALTVPEQNVFLRFEGLNTAENKIPVIVEVFNVALSPLQELALLSEEYQSFASEGTVMPDPKRLTGSKYYLVRKKA